MVRSPHNSSWLLRCADVFVALPRDEKVEKHFRTIRDHESEIKLALKAYVAGQRGYSKLTKSPGNPVSAS